MKNDNIDELLENQSLKDEFKMRNLDLSEAFCATPDNLLRENNVLRNLLDWVQKYSECSNRKEMEAEGYDFPPIDPGISPDNDWYRFELWMQGKPTRQKLKGRLQPGFIPTPLDELTDDELLLELGSLIEMLAEIHVAEKVHKPALLQPGETISQLDIHFSRRMLLAKWEKWSLQFFAKMLYLIP